MRYRSLREKVYRIRLIERLSRNTFYKGVMQVGDRLNAIKLGGLDQDGDNNSVLSIAILLSETDRLAQG